MRSVVAVALAAGLLGVLSLGLAPGAVAMAQIDCEITDATLSWGFKESFRAYIDGDIANGEWTAADGATYETPAFGWSGGTGRYDPATGEGYIEFTGSVRFTGHDGVLDTTIADPYVVLKGDSALMLLDVAGPTMDGTQVDQDDVPFVSMPSVEVVGTDAVRTLDAATTLTADGAIAFPNYESGEAFDPVSISMTVGKVCPVGYNGGDVVDAEVVGLPWLPGFIAVAVVATLAAVAGILAATRRRRA